MRPSPGGVSSPDAERARPGAFEVALLQRQIEGKYEILAKIREGGMGAVYKVRHQLLDEVRVIKVIRHHLEASPDLADRFRREAQVAIRLRHPNIAQLHDFAVDADGNAFIVMEFIDGVTLEELGGAAPAPVGLVLEAAQQALRALGYLHRPGFVHRDISPDNLMLTRGVDGEPLVKLIDLGIAKFLEGGDAGLTTTGIFLGKPRYASPEQFGAEGALGLDGRSDLYSFGVVLYELLTGRCPISGRDPSSYMAGHLFRPPLDFAESDPGGRLPADLRRLVLQTLAKRPEERPATAEALGQALAAVQERHPFSNDDLERALRSAREEEALATRATAAGEAGSTQDRLDREFARRTTPPPEARPLPPPRAPVQAAGALDGPTAVLPLAEAETAAGEDALPLRGRGLAPGRHGDDDWASQTLDLGTVSPLTWPEFTTLGSGTASLAGAAAARPRAPRTVAYVLAAVVLLGLLGGGAWLWRDRGRVLLQHWSATMRAAESGAAAPAGGVAGSAGERTAPAPPDEIGEIEVQAPVDETPAPAGPRIGEVVAVPPPGSPPPAAETAPAPTAADPPPERRRFLPNPFTAPDLLRPGPGVEEAEPLEIAAAAYPAAARGSGRSASVLVYVLVDEEGRVRDARLAEEDASGLGFGEAALAAARRTRFFPARRDGVPGRAAADLRFEFTPPP